MVIPYYRGASVFNYSGLCKECNSWLIFWSYQCRVVMLYWVCNGWLRLALSCGTLQTSQWSSRIKVLKFVCRACLLVQFLGPQGTTVPRFRLATQHYLFSL